MKSRTSYFRYECIFARQSAEKSVRWKSQLENDNLKLHSCSIETITLEIMFYKFFDLIPLIFLETEITNVTNI